MTIHLLKMLWHRKGANALLIAEVFISFLVLVGVVTAGVYSLDNYRKPLGFTYDRVWNIAVDVKQQSDDYWSSDMVNSSRQVELALRSFPELEAVGGMLYPPYSLGNSVRIFNEHGRTVTWTLGEVTDGLQQALNIHVVAGRWFNQSDDAMSGRPVVINQQMAREVFGGRDPIGQPLREQDPNSPWRVVGVVDDFRKDGELSGTGNFAFLRINLADTVNRPPRNFLVKVRPGTPLSLQQKISEQLQGTVKGWSFDVRSLADMRETYFRLRLAGLLVVGTIVGSLILMVALGLIGVLWQNVTRRRSEIGLRRALGAAASDVQRQILTELVILGSFGIILGTVLVVQFPILGVFGSVSWYVYAAGLALSLLFIYGVIVLAALYPSRIATQIQPIEALRYE